MTSLWRHFRLTYGRYEFFFCTGCKIGGRKGTTCFVSIASFIWQLLKKKREEALDITPVGRGFSKRDEWNLYLYLYLLHTINRSENPIIDGVRHIKTINTTYIAKTSTSSIFGDRARKIPIPASKRNWAITRRTIGFLTSQTTKLLSQIKLPTCWEGVQFPLKETVHLRKICIF